MSRRASIAAVASAILVLAASSFAQDKPLPGQKVYADRKCSVCHSVAALDERTRSKTVADEIRAWMVTPKEMTVKTKAERKPAMLTYPDLAKADLDALVNYLVSLKKAP